MNQFKYIILLLLCIFSHYALAQVVGRVNESDGSPMPFVTVSWENSNISTQTTITGQFSIKRPKDGKSLKFSFSGFESQTVKVGNSEDSIFVVLKKEQTPIDNIKVTAKREGRVQDTKSVENVEIIGLRELQRFACCNLGESFTANPSVDVSYSDAATGAKQIKLLGLSGSYVQILTENFPNFRITAAPFALGYVPGTWMQGIQVSKGITSVKQGFEGITGQINIDYKKPQRPEPEILNLNLYADNNGRIEANADATVQVSKIAGTTILAHYENETTQHDSNNDGFMDTPQIEQFNLMDRWTFEWRNFHSEAGVRGLFEKRTSGQSTSHGHSLNLTHKDVDHSILNADGSVPAYKVNIDTRRVEAYAKNAYSFDRAHNSSIALILSGSFHNQESSFGFRIFDNRQWNGYSSLIFETEFNKHHSLSTGLNFNFDSFRRNYQLSRLPSSQEQVKQGDNENNFGGYGQYTYSIDKKISIVAGMRLDRSSLWGTFFTPRLHLKIEPMRLMSIRISGGKGYRTAYVLDENNNLLAGSREIVFSDNRYQEEAWNAGVNWSYKHRILGKLLTLSAEYYYTDFAKQLVVDMDSDPHAIRFYKLNGRSYSHVFQFEAGYPLLKGLQLNMAYRYTDSKSTYNGVRRTKPLTSRYKAVMSLSYKSPLEKWQFDLALQLNGGGRMPTPYTNSDGTQSWSDTFSSYPQLSAQVSRYFRLFTIYAGGENLTAFKQSNPIIGAQNPWTSSFDPSMVWGPMHGAKFYVGIRFELDKN